MLMEQFNLSRYVVALPIPGMSDLSIRYVAVRHQRVVGSPVHDFLYRQVLEQTEEIRASLGLPDLQTLRRERGLDY